MTLTLGPIAIALDRLVAVALLWAFLELGRWLARRGPGAAHRVSVWAVCVGVGVARAVFVATHWNAFAIDPLAILAVWQGGFALWPGVAAAALVVLLMLGRTRAAGLMVGALVGFAALLSGATLLTRAPDRPLSGDLSLTTLDGAQLELTALHGAPFVISLWASWCPPCRRELPMLTEVARDARVRILLVNTGEEPSEVRRFLGEHGLDATNVVLDRQSAVMSATGASSLPTTLFVDAQGWVRGRHAGEISRAALLDGVQHVAESRAP